MGATGAAAGTGRGTVSLDISAVREAARAVRRDAETAADRRDLAAAVRLLGSVSYHEFEPAIMTGMDGTTMPSLMMRGEDGHETHLVSLPVGFGFACTCPRPDRSCVHEWVLRIAVELRRREAVERGVLPRGRSGRRG